MRKFAVVKTLNQPRTTPLPTLGQTAGTIMIDRRSICLPLAEFAFDTAGATLCRHFINLMDRSPDRFRRLAFRKR
ncbi:MAG: hypothetical protein MR450_00035 [Prevotella sp.]|nr:hypothetical protein [Prevotella sp.]MDY4037857.1 hypothetical protein [Prevotella sp.]